MPVGSWRRAPGWGGGGDNSALLGEVVVVEVILPLLRLGGSVVGGVDAVDEVLHDLDLRPDRRLHSPLLHGQAEEVDLPELQNVV